MVSTAGKLRKLYATESGRIAPEGQPWPEPLSDLMERYQARWALQLRSGALEQVMERFAAGLRPEHSTLEQWHLLWLALRQAEADGLITSAPKSLDSLAVPSPGLVRKAWNAVCPVGRTMVLAVFEEERLYTALVVRRGVDDGVDVLLGPESLRRSVGLLSGDFHRDHRYVARAITRDIAAPALGCYVERHTLEALLSDQRPGAWAAAVATRDVIVSPAPPAVAVPLGLDAGRAAVVAMRGLAERVGARAWFEPEGPMGLLLSRVRELTPDELDLEKILGFDPLRLLVTLLRDGQGRD